ncbi:hypothetical protein SNEBB_004840 [Seison nebaliae]|nr:hypothetical protein SNEBB_004840 [Seison nebaliae]
MSSTYLVKSLIIVGVDNGGKETVVKELCTRFPSVFSEVRKFVTKEDPNEQSLNVHLVTEESVVNDIDRYDVYYYERHFERYVGFLKSDVEEIRNNKQIVVIIATPYILEQEKIRFKEYNWLYISPIDIQTMQRFYLSTNADDMVERLHQTSQQLKIPKDVQWLQEFTITFTEINEVMGKVQRILVEDITEIEHLQSSLYISPLLTETNEELRTPWSVKNYVKSILSESEQRKLNRQKINVQLENEKYLTNHPELEYLMIEYLKSIFLHRPQNVYEHSAKFFQTFEISQNVKGKRKENVNKINEITEQLANDFRL